MTDAGEFVFLPKLAAMLRSRAPGVRLQIVPLEFDSLTRALGDGALDLAIGPLPLEGAGELHSRVLFRERYAGLVRRQGELHKLALAGAGSATHTETRIEDTLRGLGVTWLRTVHTYGVGEMKRTLEAALTTPEPGLKVIIAEGECQLERQRRTKPWIAGLLKAGKRVVKVRYGVDADTCSGDHSCIRLSGCPTLTLKDSGDPLKADPVATVVDGCVGCGLCGENAHAATLCPSFYRAEVVKNPGLFERALAGLRRGVIGMLAR